MGSVQPLQLRLDDAGPRRSVDVPRNALVLAAHWPDAASFVESAGGTRRSIAAVLDRGATRAVGRALGRALQAPAQGQRALLEALRWLAACDALLAPDAHVALLEAAVEVATQRTFIPRWAPWEPADHLGHAEVILGPHPPACRRDLVRDGFVRSQTCRHPLERRRSPFVAALEGGEQGESVVARLRTAMDPAAPPDALALLTLDHDELVAGAAATNHATDDAAAEAAIVRLAPIAGEPLLPWLADRPRLSERTIEALLAAVDPLVDTVLMLREDVPSWLRPPSLAPYELAAKAHAAAGGARPMSSRPRWDDLPEPDDLTPYPVTAEIAALDGMVLPGVYGGSRVRLRRLGTRHDLVRNGHAMRNCTANLHEPMQRGGLAVFAAEDLTTGEPVANISLERSGLGWWLDSVLGQRNTDAAEWLEDDLDALTNELLPGNKPPPLTHLPAGLLDDDFALADPLRG